MTTTPRWLGTRQAADLLGVKPETVYAYVSRGVLERHRSPDGRSSRFSRVEVERLAARNRRGGRAGALEVVIDSGLTLLDPEGGLFYRGTDATELARTSTFERVAELLWGSTYRTSAWTVPEAVTDVARKAVAALPAPARPTDRLRVAVAALAALAGADDHRDDRRPEYVTRAARTAILAGVEALPRRSTPQGTTVAHRLWSRLSGRPPERGEIRALT
ncbi:MAG TPA: helix-turn-helix domain-containing protein, partial [Actinopolymorphaceae bacterium]